METAQPSGRESQSKGNCISANVDNKFEPDSSAARFTGFRFCACVGVEHGWDPDSPSVRVLCEAAGIRQEQRLLRIYQTSHRQISHSGVRQVWWNCREWLFVRFFPYVLIFFLPLSLFFILSILASHPLSSCIFFTLKRAVIIRDALIPRLSVRVHVFWCLLIRAPILE